MKISYSSRSIMHAMLFLLLSLFTIVYTYLYRGDNGFFALSVAITIELIVFFMIMNKVEGRLLSFATIFIAILALFHFGQVFLCGYWSDLIPEMKLRIVLNYFSDSDCIAAMRVINISFVGICMGVILSSRKDELQHGNQSDIDLAEAIINERHALLLIKITFPIKIIIDIVFFYLSFSTGFTSAVIWLGRFPDIIRTIGDISMLGFGVLIVSLSYDRQKQFRVFAFIMTYLLIQIISGRRSETIAYITILAFLFYQTRTHKKRKVGSIILIAIFAYFLLTFMYAAVRIRDLDNRTIEGFFQLFWELLFKHNIFMEAIREYGNTGYTPVCVLNNWLNSYPPSYGKSYLFGISAIFPNIGGIVSYLINESTYAIQLQKYGMVLDGFRNIGGSVIGELFFNFGKIGGLVVSPILGMLIGKVSQKERMYATTYQIKKMAYYIPAMYAILYWVRDCFGEGIREVVWGIVIWYLIGLVNVKDSRV